MHKLLMGLIVTLIAYAEGAPGDVAAAGSASVSGSTRPPLISFENGKIGVNFLGFKASAGLGGLLTGNMADGGLQAEAETPFGHKAGAGLGGTVDENGQTQGYKYRYHTKRSSTNENILIPIVPITA